MCFPWSFHFVFINIYSEVCYVIIFDYISWTLRPFDLSSKMSKRRICHQRLTEQIWEEAKDMNKLRREIRGFFSVCLFFCIVVVEKVVTHCARLWLAVTPDTEMAFPVLPNFTRLLTTLHERVCSRCLWQSVAHSWIQQTLRNLAWQKSAASGSLSSQAEMANGWSKRRVIRKFTCCLSWDPFNSETGFYSFLFWDNCLGQILNCVLRNWDLHVALQMYWWEEDLN